ncbi:MAG: cytochrome c oxidase subunit II [Halobacteriaceae archaeon]
MRKWHLVPLLFVAALGVFAAPAAAQGASASSVTERLIRNLNSNLLAVAVPVTLLTEGILVYTVWKFRKTDEAKPTRENRRLEITWTVTTAIILLYVGFAAYGVMANPYVTTTAADVNDAAVTGGPGPVVVTAIGQQWFWTFHYNGTNITVQDTMVIPANRDVVIQTQSRDVIHSYHVPALGLKMDAIPGETRYIKTKVTATGEYQLYCAEYCGAGHSQMLGTVRVVSQEEFQNWLDQQRQQANAGNSTSSGNGTASLAAPGPVPASV